MSLSLEDFLRKPQCGLGSEAACECYEALKAIYGLRIAPRAFQEHFVKRVTKHCFRTSVAHPQVYIGHSQFEGGFMTAWVDDVMIVASETMFENIMKMLEEEFLLKRGP